MVDIIIMTRVIPHDRDMNNNNNNSIKNFCIIKKPARAKVVINNGYPWGFMMEMQFEQMSWDFYKMKINFQTDDLIIILSTQERLLHLPESWHLALNGSISYLLISDREWRVVTATMRFIFDELCWMLIAY